MPPEQLAVLHHLVSGDLVQEQGDILDRLAGD